MAETYYDPDAEAYFEDDEPGPAESSYLEGAELGVEEAEEMADRLDAIENARIGEGVGGALEQGYEDVFDDTAEMAAEQEAAEEEAEEFLDGLMGELEQRLDRRLSHSEEMAIIERLPENIDIDYDDVERAAREMGIGGFGRMEDRENRVNYINDRARELGMTDR
jgi:hypothetical protein